MKMRPIANFLQVASLVMMLIAAVVPYWIFKWKKWL